MTSNFCKSHLEEATFEWFANLRYEIVFAPDIAHDGSSPKCADYREVILPQWVKNAL